MPAELLAKAISSVESGGKQVKGASGEFGIFQFFPATWTILSKAYNKEKTGENRTLFQSPENEWKVAVWKIDKLLKKFTPREVAMIWNTSLCGRELPLVRKGVNKYGVRYDSEAYAQKVINVYNSLV